jgi:hypothetical protein
MHKKTRVRHWSGLIVQKRDFPNPRTLPAQPAWQTPRPQLILSELIPRKYVSTTARIACVKTSEVKFGSSSLVFYCIFLLVTNPVTAVLIIAKGLFM